MKNKKSIFYLVAIIIILIIASIILFVSYSDEKKEKEHYQKLGYFDCMLVNDFIELVNIQSDSQLNYENLDCSVYDFIIEN